MADFVEKIVLRLRQGEPFSRNRHFHALSSAEGKRALRIHRHVLSIERDIAKGFATQIELIGDGARVTLRAKNSTRVATLTALELKILLMNPVARVALGFASAA
jgi:hypothetical protein